jgi:hypothetical protein
MPDNYHLDWVDIKDFTPGLWTRNRATMPYNAAQALSDAFPLQDGGLRPFMDDASITTSGMDISAGNRIIGIGSHVGVPYRSGVGLGTAADRYVMKYDTSDNELRLYRMDETNNETTWTELTTWSPDNPDPASTDHYAQAFFEPFIDQNGTRWMLLGLNYNDAGFTLAGAGLYMIRYEEPDIGNDGEVTLIQNVKISGLIVNQGRWMFAQSGTSKLYYSNVGSTEPTANYLEVTPSGRGSNITALSSQEPSDILVGKEGAPWVAIQGDISNSNTVVRELAGSHPAGPWPIRPTPAPGGVVFIEGKGTVFLTDGRNFEDLGKAIVPPTLSYMNTAVPGIGVVGMAGYIGDFLFVPGGKVRDMRTGAWLTISQPDGDDKALWLPDNSRYSIWGASLSEAGDATMTEYRSSLSIQNATTHGAPSCSWTSAPQYTKDGGDVRIREVQIWVETGAATANDFTVTRFNDDDGGSVARSVENLGANLQRRLRFLFPNSGSSSQYIKLDWNTSGEDTEAAFIQRIRIGLAPAKGN